MVHIYDFSIKYLSHSYDFSIHFTLYIAHFSNFIPCSTGKHDANAPEKEVLGRQKRESAKFPTKPKTRSGFHFRCGFHYFISFTSLSVIIIMFLAAVFDFQTGNCAGEGHLRVVIFTDALLLQQCFLRGVG